MAHALGYLVFSYHVTNAIRCTLTVHCCLFARREQLVPESVPWLIANHKLEKAEGIVRRVFQTYHARLPASLSVRRQVQMQIHFSDHPQGGVICNFGGVYI